MKKENLKDGVFYKMLNEEFCNCILQYDKKVKQCKGYWEGGGNNDGWGVWSFDESDNWTKATLEELNALGDEHLPYSKYLQDTVSTPIFTLKDLTEGRVALLNDGTAEEVFKVVSASFPNDTYNYILKEDFYFRRNQTFPYFMVSNTNIGMWRIEATPLDLPVQSTKIFLKELNTEPNIISDWFDKNGRNPVIHAQVEREADALMGITPKGEEVLMEELNSVGYSFKTFPITVTGENAESLLESVYCKEEVQAKQMREFETGATRNLSDDKLDFEGFLSPLALEEFAKYMHKHRLQADGKLRDSDNWQKGMPIKEYMKSLYRHFFDTWKDYRGLKTPEDQITNLCAVIFNAQGMLHEILKAK